MDEHGVLAIGRIYLGYLRDNPQYSVGRDIPGSLVANLHQAVDTLLKASETTERAHHNWMNSVFERMSAQENLTNLLDQTSHHLSHKMVDSH